MQKRCYKSITVVLIWRKNERGRRPLVINSTERMCRAARLSAQPHKPDSPEYTPKMTVAAITIATIAA
jgi:hypothetical protein